MNSKKVLATAGVVAAAGLVAATLQTSAHASTAQANPIVVEQSAPAYQGDLDDPQFIGAAAKAVGKAAQRATVHAKQVRAPGLGAQNLLGSLLGTPMGSEYSMTDKVFDK